MTEDFADKIPPLHVLETRFGFIDNPMLKQNAAIYLRYVMFLLALSEEDGLESLTYTVYKDIIIFTASTIEAALDYTCRKLILQGKADEDIYGVTKKLEDVGGIKHDCEDLYHAELRVVKKSKVLKLHSGDDISFAEINRAAKSAKVLDDKLFDAAEKLRNKRNTIHLITLKKSSDDYFKKSDVEDAFKYAHDILLKIESLSVAV